MRAGRIETYMHSDKTTQNKGGALVLVSSLTDFGAKTDGFKAFAARVAQRAYGADAADWAALIVHFPEMEQERVELAKSLRETVQVEEIRILKL